LDEQLLVNDSSKFFSAVPVRLHSTQPLVFFSLDFLDESALKAEINIAKI
jgi:hypothetical protein